MRKVRYGEFYICLYYWLRESVVVEVVFINLYCIVFYGWKVLFSGWENFRVVDKLIIVFLWLLKYLGVFRKKGK